MKVTIVTPITALALLVTLAGAAKQERAVNQVDTSGVSVTFDTGSEIVRGEPVVLLLTIRNSSADFVEVDLGWDRKQSLRVTVVEPDGTSVDTQRPRPSGIARVPEVRIASRQTYSQRYVLDERMSLDTPGAYTLKVGLDATFRASDGRAIAPVTDTVFLVNVKPRDVPALRRHCDALADEALNGTVYENRDDGADVLGYMNDEAAVPCIQKVMRATNRYDHLMMRGLVRIGTESARVVTQEMFLSDDFLRYQLASDALVRMQRQSK